MEARLFFISIWCAVYGQLVRGVMRSRGLVDRIWVTMVVNSLFWATFGAMLGMLFASYYEKVEETGFYAILFAGAGVLIGAGLGYVNGREEGKRAELIKDNLEWADTGFSAILLAAVVMFFIVQAFKIPSGSMRMTFVEGDHLFVNKFVYGVPIPFTDKKVMPMREVTAGDVVIFRFPSQDKESLHYGKDFIKRAIATAGQTVQIVNKKTFVDGQPIDETYKQHVDPLIYSGTLEFPPHVYQKRWEDGQFSDLAGNEICDNFGPVTVPEGHVMVMGDNRDRSFDSRFWGPLPIRDIKGKAWLLYWPVKRFRVIR